MEKGKFSQQDMRGKFTAKLLPYAGVGSLRVSALLFSTLASIIVARTLGPSDYGQVVFVLAVLSLASIPSNNALQPLYVREISEDDQNKNYARMQRFLQWTARTAGTSALAFVLPIVGIAVSFAFLSNSEFSLLFVISAPLLFLWATNARISGILQGFNRVVLAQVFDWLVNPLTYLVCIAILALTNLLTPFTVLSSSLLSVFVGAVVGLLVLRRMLTDVRESSPAEISTSHWLRAWQNFMVIQAVTVINLRAPIILLGILAGEADAGYYRVSDNIASLLSMTLLIANMVIGPKITRLYKAGKIEALGRLAKNTARIALAVSLPVVVSMLFYGEEVLELLFGRDFIAAAPILSILVLGQLINIGTGSVALIMNMTGHEKDARTTWIIALLLNLALGIILIPYFGAIGAAIAATASTTTWNILLLRQTKKSIGVNPGVI